ncbi:hypothetical protein FRC18_004897 [Serendipita sp. 400]|nr:hypothetical protein FRC18_004897 [Serendipita sp. 400]
MALSRSLPFADVVTIPYGINVVVSFAICVICVVVILVLFKYKERENERNEGRGRGRDVEVERCLARSALGLVDCLSRARLGRTALVIPSTDYLSFFSITNPGKWGAAHSVTPTVEGEIDLWKTLLSKIY